MTMIIQAWRRDIMAQKVVVLTGSSSGIGSSIGRDLVDHGYRVFGFSRRKGGLPGVEHLEVDVRDDVAVRAAIDAVLREAGRIDVLINSAGYTVIGAVEESSIEQAQALFDTNVFGLMRVTRAVLPAMRKQRAGRIVNISSVVGFIPAPFMGLYASTKHAVEGYTESLDHEVRTFGIRAICIEPGFTSTKIEHNSLKADQPLDDYRAATGRAAMFIGKAIENGMDPDIVARRVREAIEAKHPKLRYPAASTDLLLSRLRRFVPERMFDSSLRRNFRLDGQQ
jgi:short-subunit dehydrogenase